jgi:hypothetical protein
MAPRSVEEGKGVYPSSEFNSLLDDLQRSRLCLLLPKLAHSFHFSLLYSTFVSISRVG